jgi:hypothetical protein
VHELDAQATMVDPSRISSGLSTSITRGDVESALREKDVPPLMLDLHRGEEHTGSVSVAWKRDDLEGLLREATGDQIQLTFDREAIEQAFGDFELHGMREKVAIVAVAVTAAAGIAAGGASGMPMSDGGGAPAVGIAAPAATTAVDPPIASAIRDATPAPTAATPAIDPAIATAMRDAAPGRVPAATEAPAIDAPIATAMRDASPAPAAETPAIDAPIATAMRDAAPVAASPGIDAPIATAIRDAAPAPSAQTPAIDAPIATAIRDAAPAPSAQTPAIDAPIATAIRDASPAPSGATGDGSTFADLGPAAAVGAGAALLVIAGAAFVTGSRRRVPAT